MGKWYCNLQKKYRVLILISIWILSLLMLILASVLTDEDGNPNGVCSLLWLIALVFDICFSVLFIKASKHEASSKKNDTGFQANLEVIPTELNDDQIQARGEEKRKMVIDSTKTSKIQTEGYSNPSEFIALDLETHNTNNDSVSSISFVHIRDGGSYPQGF